MSTVRPFAGVEQLQTNQDNSLAAKITFELPKANPGDYFDLTISDNVDLKGISATAVADDIKNEQIVLASAEIINATKIRYTFTNSVSSLTNIKGSMKLPLFIDKDKVPNTSSQNTVVTVGKDSTTLPVMVDYTLYVGPNDDSNGNADLNNIDFVNKTVTHTAYYNPNKATIINREIDFYNLSGSGVIYDQDALDSVKVYRLKEGQELSQSFAIDKSKFDEITSQVTKQINYSELLETTAYLSVYFNNTTKNNEQYVVQYTAKFDPGTEESPKDIKTNTRFTGKNSLSAKSYDWTWGNAINLYGGVANGSGLLQEPGQFQEHHIYITKDQDGVETASEKVDGQDLEGRRNELYSTGKQDKDGYAFIKTENPINNPAYNEKGDRVSGNFVPKTKQEITYVYERVVEDPQKVPGSFQEHHIYITKDQDGVETARETVDGQLETGRKEATYATGKKDKADFRFVRTEKPINGPKYTATGDTVNGNFVPNIKQEITYVYERVVEDPQKVPGSFQEHHIYQTIDESGNLVSVDDTVDGKVLEGTMKDNYTTGRLDREGYTFVRTQDVKEGAAHHEDGSRATGTFKGRAFQEVTYVYQRLLIRSTDSHVIDFDGNTAPGESGSNNGTEEITEHGPIIENETDSSEIISGSNNGTEEITEHGPIIENETDSSEIISGSNNGTEEITEHGPIIEDETDSSEIISGSNDGTEEITETGPLVDFDFNSPEIISGANDGQTVIEEDKPVLSQKALADKEPENPKVVAKVSKPELPSTGDKSSVLSILGLVLSVLALAFTKRRTSEK
ncbi:Ig-like domain-containing protein [Streptococcus didelphis]|uniref:Ig-like domain-containing protein n=1 Tax=Streptococcus didelphis TaxID=102886 RepID=UPI0027D2F791|nr:Ig-like domain-containing protein [Streptococcus didelphis]WMB30161.1 Ig-like domain-containing protein [Streptococcus didelphis]